MKQILNLFRKKYTKQKIKSNQILLEIKEDGSLSMECMLENNDQNNAIYLAKFLYELNSGQYIQNFINLLTDIGKNNKEYESFIDKTLNAMTFYILKNEKYNKPIISPSQFYRGDK